MTVSVLRGFCSGRVILVDTQGIGQLKSNILERPKNNVIICEKSNVDSIKLLEDFLPSQVDLGDKVVFFANTAMHKSLRACENMERIRGQFVECNPSVATHYCFSNEVQRSDSYKFSLFSIKGSQVLEECRQDLVPMRELKYPATYSISQQYRPEVRWYFDDHTTKSIREDNYKVAVEKASTGYYAKMAKYEKSIPFYFLEAEPCV